MRLLLSVLLVVGLFCPVHRHVDVHLMSHEGSPVTPSTFLSDDNESTVLVMGPSGIATPSQGYLDTVQDTYLAALGYTGDSVVPLTTPELMYATATTLGNDEAVLYQSIMDQLSADPDNPVIVFGYSQSAAAASEVENELLAAGVSTDDVKFILVGDSGSQYGLLNLILESLPGWLRAWVVQQIYAWDLQGVLSMPDEPPATDITPTDAYPTMVFTLPHDGYADWPQDIFADPNETLQDIAGMFSTHLEYLGLTEDQVAAALDNADVEGTTIYFTIPDDTINPLEAIIQAGINVGWL